MFSFGIITISSTPSIAKICCDHAVVSIPVGRVIVRLVKYGGDAIGRINNNAMTVTMASTVHDSHIGLVSKIPPMAPPTKAPKNCADELIPIAVALLATGARLEIQDGMVASRLLKPM